MLAHLKVTNFGLIDSLEMEFVSGLNILTGSTGAGKSIIIDALRFALGERMNSSFVRDKDKTCVIEAVFELTDPALRQTPLFQEFLQEEDVLIIHRHYLPDGRNRIKVNGSNVTVAQLKELGDRLVDFHGPHDHQLLLSEDSHLTIIDQLSDFKDVKDDYWKKYRVYTDLKAEYEKLQEMAASRQRDLDLLDHQVKELGAVPLDAGRYEELCQQQVRMNNTEKLFEHASSLLQILEADGVGISEMVSRAYSPLRGLMQVDESVAKFEAYLDQIQEANGGLVTELRDYLESLSYEPGEAQEISRRYDLYDEILRKYGPSLEEAARFYDEALKKFELLRDFEQNDRDLKKKMTVAREEVKIIADQITQVRKKTGAALKKTIEKELKDLGIENVKFEARVSPVDEFRSTGQDKVVFYISPNAGEDLKPMAEIVSSGEAARIMLALKKALTKVDPVPVLIFDEIDAQIGGRLGQITGTKLKEISTARQVLLITHLPQIASFADLHFKVVKKVDSGRTFTAIEKLDKQRQVEELAQMMSGEKKSRISVSHAEDMLAQASRIK